MIDHAAIVKYLAPIEINGEWYVKTKGKTSTGDRLFVLRHTEDSQGAIPTWAFCGYIDNLERHDD